MEREPNDIQYELDEMTEEEREVYVEGFYHLMEAWAFVDNVLINRDEPQPEITARVPLDDERVIVMDFMPLLQQQLFFVVETAHERMVQMGLEEQAKIIIEGCNQKWYEIE